MRSHQKTMILIVLITSTSYRVCCLQVHIKPYVANSYTNAGGKSICSFVLLVSFLLTLQLTRGCSMYNTGPEPWYTKSSHGFGEPNPALPEVENGVIGAHEDVSKYPAIPWHEASIRWIARIKQAKGWWRALGRIPERAARGRHVERHEPTDANGLAWLLQLHYVLQHKGETFRLHICSK